MFLFLIFFYLFHSAQAQIINCELGAQDTALPREENNCMTHGMQAMCGCENTDLCPAGFHFICPGGSNCVFPTVTPTATVTPTPQTGCCRCSSCPDAPSGICSDGIILTSDACAHFCHVTNNCGDGSSLNNGPCSGNSLCNGIIGTLTPTRTPTFTNAPTSSPTWTTVPVTPTWTAVSLTPSPTPTTVIHTLTPTITQTFTPTFTPLPPQPTSTPGATPTFEPCPADIYQVQDLGSFASPTFSLPSPIHRHHAIIMVQEPEDIACVPPGPLFDSQFNRYFCPAGHCDSAIINQLLIGDTIPNPCGTSSTNPWHVYDYFGIKATVVGGFCHVATGALTSCGGRNGCLCYTSCPGGPFSNCIVPCSGDYDVGAGCLCNGGHCPAPPGANWGDSLIICGAGDLDPSIVSVQRFTRVPGVFAVPYTASCGFTDYLDCVSDLYGCVSCDVPNPATPTDTPTITPSPTCVQGRCVKITPTPTV